MPPQKLFMRYEIFIIDRNTYAVQQKSVKNIWLLMLDSYYTDSEDIINFHNYRSGNSDKISQTL